MQCLINISEHIISTCKNFHLSILFSSTVGKRRDNYLMINRLQMKNLFFSWVSQVTLTMYRCRHMLANIQEAQSRDKDFSEHRFPSSFILSFLLYQTTLHLKDISVVLEKQCISTNDKTPGANFGANMIKIFFLFVLSGFLVMTKLPLFSLSQKACVSRNIRPFFILC